MCAYSCDLQEKAVEFHIMINDKTASDLHDRATRGMPLSPQDQANLKEWYEKQDQCETNALLHPAPPGDLVGIRHQVNVALVGLQTVTQRIQDLAGENETLKQEIAVLQRKVKNAQPA